MKKFQRILFLTVVALSMVLPLSGQTVITLSGQTGAFKVLRGTAWNLAASTNVLLFTWTPSSLASQYSCVSIANNNPTNAHTFTVNTYTTQDPFAQAGNLTRWQIAFGGGGSTATVNASGVGGSTATFAIPMQGAAQASFAMSLTSGLAGTPDSFDILVSDSAVPCYFSSFLTGGTVPRPCALSQVFTAATATITLVQIVPSTQASSIGRWHVCAFNFSGAAATTAANLAIGVGDTASTCATISQTFWAYNAGVGIPNSSLNGSPEVFSATGNRALCFQNVGTGTTAQLSINFDYW